MNTLDRETVKNAFNAYTENYNASDPKIKLKIAHTYRVANLCERIADTVPSADKDLAWLSGMLHDVGRFEQVKRYNTFSDADSVDHAAFGADLLFKEHLIDSFGTFDKDCVDILETAIRNHNRFRIEEGLSDEYMTYCRILRDADKIDIFRVNTETPLEEIYNVTSEELKQAAVSDAVKNGFKEKRALIRNERKTPADILVGHICLVHELEYPISVKIAWEQGYLDQLLQFRSDNEETNEWFAYMRSALSQQGK
ncbi:MAG: HD domain-containing protein [Oscillospiraceae bacterium]|nr:HD domain-containing protein [Oscillospiraceae bacterium]MBP5385532.1 HD domain-containing protein [Lachnospiraceae bacterium]